ncbi:MAG TPA: PepSY domain-containing protein [Stellaceae bacterium]|nr:PepSY domain-containing protein [Stellaceae bacterium]
MTRTGFVTLAIAGACAASLCGAAGAHAEANDAAIMANAKVTLTQAIVAAEQHTGGKAIGADVEQQNGTPFIEVEVVKDNQEQKVLVNPQNGQVAKVVAADEEKSEHEKD